MRSSAWRAVLVGICAFALVQGFVAWWLAWNRIGVTGTSVAGAHAPLVWRIAVRPESPAYRSGLRTGDLVDAARMSSAQRYRLWTSVYPLGDRATIPIVRNGNATPVVVTAERGARRWDSLFGWIGGQWIFLWALLLAWRRAESREASLLVLMLVISNLGLDLLPVNWVTPWPLADLVAVVVGQVCLLSYALLATYALLFARPPALGRRVLTWLSYGAAGVAAAIGSAAAISAWVGFPNPMMTGYSLLFQSLSTPMALSLLCAIAAFAAARGAERERLGWVLASLSLWMIGSIGIGLTSVLGLSSPAVLFAFANVGLLIASAGLTYALLSRRLLDIGFAINRAAVFTVVSLIVVGMFVLVEWALGEWLASAGHAANLAASAALALALGFSVRAIHQRVDRTLDGVFFRKRHEDEQALRTFAREAPYITELPVLLERTVKTLENRADAATVVLELHDGNGRYGDISENDPALVSLRASHRVLDLHEVSTALRGEFAYPMVARGRLVGVLVLGAKRSGESYAPDESSAIEQLAHGVASAIDVLSLRGESSREDRLLDGIQEVRRAISELAAQLAPSDEKGA